MTQITSGIFISGVNELQAMPLAKLGIGHVICCLDPNLVIGMYRQIIARYPNLVVLFLPMNDDLTQDLFTTQDRIQMINSRELMPQLARPGVRTANGCDVGSSRASSGLSSRASSGVSSAEMMYRGKPYAKVGNHFINCALAKGSKVLVHCMAGISRSVSVVTYHLMITYGLSYDRAIKLIRSRRPIANPNSNFINQLRSSSRNSHG